MCITDDGVECMVTVLLDGQEAIMEFTDFPHTGVGSRIMEKITNKIYQTYSIVHLY